MLRTVRTAFLAFIVICAPARAAEVPSGGELDDFVRAYQTERADVLRFYNLPWSEVLFDRMEQFYRRWESLLSAIEFEKLNQQGRIDYILLRNHIDHRQRELLETRSRLSEMAPLLPFRKAIQQLERTRWKMDPLDSQAAATVVSGLPAQIKKVRELVERGRKEGGGAGENAPPKVSHVLARRTARAVEDIRNSLKNWYGFYDGYRPDFNWWLKRPYDETNRALEEYSKYLREEIAEQKGRDEDPLLGEVLGGPGLASDLAAESLPYTAEDLMAIGEREFAWCEKQMRHAAKEMGFDDWKMALAKVKADHPPPGGQDEFVTQQARDAIDFVKSNNLVTVPPLCEEMWRLTMISPDGQKSMPFAAYGGQNIMVAYAKDEMKHDDKLMSMRGNNKHFTRIVSAHELIPGHHLQIFQAARYRPYRGIFSTPFYVEGWCLYWEMALWDHKYYRSPEDKIGMLFWRMHRAARIIVSMKFHLGQMRPNEMIDFLVERVGHERLGATSEVRRFIAGDYSPLYQAGYMIGGLQIRAMHADLVGRGKMTEKEFNDTILRYGPIPIELVRAGMKNVPLTRDSKPSWRFADPLR